jgi:3D (Asp-Asp-Asp) domain-containing protein
MSKRWTLVLAFIAVFAVLVIGLIHNGGVLNELDPIYGAKTNAQGVNFDRAAAIMGKASIVSDAVAEQSIIVSYNSDKQIKVWATAYTSDPFETDNTPNVTALGTKTRDGIAAANFLPFGTKFMIPEMYGDKVFTVEDRLNARYNNQKIVDIWMSGKIEALHFGKKSITLQLL